MILEKPGQPLRSVDIPKPRLGANEVLVQVRACAICRTDLHIVDGELPNPKLPLVPGHEIVGVIVEKDERVERFKTGDRVGIPWLGWTCGECEFCLSERENLCNPRVSLATRSTAAMRSLPWPTNGSAFPFRKDFPTPKPLPSFAPG